MSQEVHVLQCFNCETFQVDIIKKVPKWSCKICGEKQSIKKVFGKGTGKECRLLVQSLNQQRIEKLNEEPEIFLNIDEIKVENNQCDNIEPSLILDNANKWAQFTNKSPCSATLPELKTEKSAPYVKPELMFENESEDIDLSL